MWLSFVSTNFFSQFKNVTAPSKQSIYGTKPVSKIEKIMGLIIKGKYKLLSNLVRKKGPFPGLG